MSYNSFHPGQVWLDTEGKRIQAHGGSVIFIDDTYYFYGENKEKTDGKNGIWHWGVKAYSSKDLYNWKDEGIIIPPEPEDENSSLHPSAQMDRPHIIYNKATKKYVCWLKIMHKDGTQDETVLTADRFLGPYTKVREGLRPLNMSAGDFDLVVAPDGKAYYMFERVHSETIIADLTDDYTDVTGYYSTHFPHPYPPYVREATAHFMRLPLEPRDIFQIHRKLRLQTPGMDRILFLEIRIREMKQILLIIPRFHRYLKYRERKISTLHAQTAGFQMRWIRIIMCTKKCLKLFSAGKRKSLIFRAWESRW